MIKVHCSMKGCDATEQAQDQFGQIRTPMGWGELVSLVSSTPTQHGAVRGLPAMRIDNHLKLNFCPACVSRLKESVKSEDLVAPEAEYELGVLDPHPTRG